MWVEVVLAVILFALLWLSIKKPAGLPPGRWGLPVVGFIPFTRKSMEQQIVELHQKHGEIYLWRMGSQVMVFINSYPLVKEAFSRPEFVDRPGWDGFKFNEVIALGVGSSNGAHWHANRRFTLRHLRDLGMGKSRLVAGIHTQAEKLVERLKLQANKAEVVPHALKVSIINVIWHMVAGVTFDIHDKKLQEFEKMIDDFNKAIFGMSLPDFFPSLKRLPKSIQNRLFQLNIIEEMKNKFFDYFGELIDEHRSSLDPENPRDFIDAYLLEMKEPVEDPDVIRSDRDLALLILDLFFAGSETTTNTLTFMIHYLAMQPEVQRKMQEEIDEVLPKGTMATLEDRAKLPYTEAALHEVLRLSALVPIGVQHCATKDTNLGGYHIPKDAVINSTVISIHKDPRYWEKPEELMPERWLDENGKFTTKKEGFLPFGVGKRVCLGESLARMELLIFATAMLQNLNFAPPPGGSVDINHDPAVVLFHTPKKEKIFITVR